MILRNIFGIVLCIVFCFCGLGDAKLAPDYIHPCNATTRECLVKSTQDAIPEFVKGIPHLGVPSLDPFVIEKLSIPLNGLKVTFYQGKVTGFRKCIVDNVVSELEKRHFVLEFHCNLTIKGQYDAVGKILLFPINGEGDAKVKLVNLRMKVDINTKYIKDDKGVNHFALKNYKYSFDYGDRVMFDLKNLFKESQELINSVIKLNIKTKYFKDAEGRDHFGIKNYKYTFDYGDRVHYTINNLFKGNPELSNTVLQFLNENWRVVTEEFGQPVVDYAMNVTIETAKKFFNAVPYDELLHVPIPKY